MEKRLEKIETKLDKIYDMLTDVRLRHEKDKAKMTITILKILAIASAAGGVSGSVLPSLVRLF